MEDLAIAPGVGAVEARLRVGQADGGVRGRGGGSRVGATGRGLSLPTRSLVLICPVYGRTNQPRILQQAIALQTKHRTQAQMAAHLGVSLRTIRRHISRATGASTSESSGQGVP